MSAEPRVTEELELCPLSEYNKTKMVAERVVTSYAGSLIATSFSSIEKLVGGSANDRFRIETGGSVSSVDGGPVDAAAPSADTLDFSTLAAGVSVNLQTKSSPGVAAFSGIEELVGTTHPDTLIGPLATLDQTLWTITGPDAGSVGATGFVSFENLTGQDSTADAFVFAAGGRITGVIAGGSGAGVVDGFAVPDASGLRAYQPGSTSGSISLNGSPTITFTGMDATARSRSTTPPRQGSWR